MGPSDNLLHSLLFVDVNRDIKPHVRSYKGLDLVWTGAYDRRNKAPIGDLPCGHRFHPVGVLGVLYEVGLRPHMPAPMTLFMCLTDKGNLMRFGGGEFSNDVDPRRRRFGTLYGSTGGLFAPHFYHGMKLDRSRSCLDVLRICDKGAKRLQDVAEWRELIYVTKEDDGQEVEAEGAEA